MPATVGGVLLIDCIYPENGLINSTFTECSTFMVLYHYALFHILVAISSRVIKIIKLEAKAVGVASTPTANCSKLKLWQNLNSEIYMVKVAC